jgi:glutathione S-transferase
MVRAVKLIIGNKNYSSWSMRPWLLLKHAGIAFDEERVSFNDPEFKRKVGRYSPAGRVPVLVDEELVIWDSLAIAEYVAEKFPEKHLWPEEHAARARARSICAEMHAGFAALREHLPMNCELRLAPGAFRRDVQADVARVLEMWRGLREQYAARGPFLFGSFSIADAYYAPVTRRFISYGVELPQLARAYVDHISGLPAMQEWLVAALGEHEFVDSDEPYRSSR